MNQSPRELDALVAEHVMGIEVFHASGGPPFVVRGKWIEAPRPYSTSIADAWLVVEEMGRAYDVEVYRYHDITSESTRWTCRIGYLLNDYPLWVARADAAPDAICCAALRAKGIEV